ncbi:hypothetical protein BU17DRAFT_72328 [Hysterangium stoloniferum]|nr:hypothetical protein BU17DRAFT_72328 [Hysterangium stoloniferum]
MQIGKKEKLALQPHAGMVQKLAYYEHVRNKVIRVFESHFQDILQRQLACNREDHGVCYHRPGRDEHVPINKKGLDSWVQQLCRGFATGLEPPQGLLDSSGIEEGMSDIERDTMSSWLKPVIRH